MKEAPLISVIVPVYNTEKYLHQCVDSILAQTLQNIEIILIDDGSTDKCSQIIDEYAKKDKRIVVVHQPHGGYGQAVNHGIALAKGEYIGVVESDDWLEPTMYELLYKNAKYFGDIDIVRCDYFKYCPSIKIDQPVQHISTDITNRIVCPLEDHNIYKLDFAIWANIYRRNFLKQNQIYMHETAGSSFQDVSFQFIVFSRTKKMVCVDIPLIHYRMDNSKSSVKDSSKIFCICEEFKCIESFLRKTNLETKLMGIKNHLKIRCYWWNVKRLSHRLSLQFLQKIYPEIKKMYQQQIEWRGLSLKERFRTFLWGHYPKIMLLVWRIRSSGSQCGL